MKITRKVKDILKNLPPECPKCRAQSGTHLLCSMCEGVKNLRMALGAEMPSTYDGDYDQYDQWIWNNEDRR